jgi:hypothetical protein
MNFSGGDPFLKEGVSPVPPLPRTFKKIGFLETVSPRVGVFILFLPKVLSGVLGGAFSKESTP